MAVRDTDVNGTSLSVVALNATSGRSQSLNVRYESGDIVLMLMAAGFAMLANFGIGFVSSGLLRRKSALTAIILPVATLAITSIQWFFLGYSLAFSNTAGAFIGDNTYMVFSGVLDNPSSVSERIPMLLFALYHGLLSALATAVVSGGIAERGRLLPAFIFAFAWTTLVYDPIAYWTLNPHGWSKRLGALDFAGGSAIHGAGGIAALVYAWLLGKRRGHGTHELNYRPHNVANVMAGTAFFWIGSLAINAGAALSADMGSVVAVSNSLVASCIGGIAWLVLDYRLGKKWSAVGLCSGIISGLTSIAVGCGYVPIWAAILIGATGSLFANLGTKIKFYLGIDDAVDIFAVHGVSTFVGSALTGFFAADNIAKLGGDTILGGWLNRHFIQLGYQVAQVAAVAAYSFVVSGIILLLLHFVLGLRITEDEEILGQDDGEASEFAYDYVYLTREILEDVENEAEGEEASELNPSDEAPLTQGYELTEFQIRRI